MRQLTETVPATDHCARFRDLVFSETGIRMAGAGESIGGTKGSIGRRASHRGWASLNVVASTRSS